LIIGLNEIGVQVNKGEDLPEVMSRDTIYLFDSINLQKIARQVVPKSSILIVHHLDSLYPSDPRYFEKYERPILDKFGGYLLSSDFTRDYLSEKGYSCNNMIVLTPPGIIKNRVTKYHNSKIKALIIANLIERKGVLAFLEELIFQKPEPFFEIRIIGSSSLDPVYASRCKELIRCDNLLKKTVKYLGEQDQQGVEQALIRSNLFVSSSFMETFGMGIQEAAVCGLPLILLDEGYAGKHVFQGNNGFRCGSISSLVKKFVQLSIDNRAFIDLQERAFSFIPDYLPDWKTTAKLLVDHSSRTMYMEKT
jgi:glycosyltransferase involved in cell wall biosynthesis